MKKKNKSQIVYVLLYLHVSQDFEWKKDGLEVAGVVASHNIKWPVRHPT